MRKIKSFRLFENHSDFENQLDSYISMYNDIESINYILEDNSIYLKFKLVINGKFLFKGINAEITRNISFTNESELLKNVKWIKSYPGGNKYESIDKLVIQLDNIDDSDNDIMDGLEFVELVKKYCNLLREHLDYIDSDLIKIDLLTSEFSEISIRNNI